MSTPTYASAIQAFSRTEPLITAAQLKERYLFGIDLTDRNGNTLPDAVIQHQIGSAISFLEHALDITILSTKIEGERHDYKAVDYTNFNFIPLKRRPVQSVSLIKAKFPNGTDLVEYPASWYVLEQDSGQVQLAPVEGSFNNLVIPNGGTYVPLLYGTKSHWPHLFHISYTAGFCQDNIPIIINEMIGMQAAIKLFEILGDLVYGSPGLASDSVSIDGASVSKGLAASGIYSVYGARIAGYEKSLKQYMDAIRGFYAGINSMIC